ncbi:MAG: hypothetical protein D6812_02375 [Deltaproteobacteria bacterium]|nr:MAG: hypothetical protein D6812_02375 [Deltaproteobacteria bacterium]
MPLFPGDPARFSPPGGGRGFRRPIDGPLPRSRGTMCTLIVAFHLDPDLPLVIGANRDERYSRPAAPPSSFEREGIRIVAPLDLEAGGTWLGLSETGLFAALTNRFGCSPRPGQRSRGEIVLDALAAGSLDHAKERVAGLDPSTYPPFHLLLATRKEALLFWHDGRRIAQRRLPPGIVLVTERSFGAAPTRREEMLRRALDPLKHPPTIEELGRLLRRHAAESFEGVCIHLPDLDYGTRSSTILCFGPTEPTFLFADGPPCRTPYGRIPLPIGDPSRRSS